MKRRKLTTLLIAATLGLGLIVQAEHPKASETPKTQTTCPVMGGKIHKAE